MRYNKSKVVDAIFYQLPLNLTDKLMFFPRENTSIHFKLNYDVIYSLPPIFSNYYIDKNSILIFRPLEKMNITKLLPLNTSNYSSPFLFPNWGLLISYYLQPNLLNSIKFLKQFELETINVIPEIDNMIHKFFENPFYRLEIPINELISYLDQNYQEQNNYLIQTVIYLIFIIEFGILVIIFNEISELETKYNLLINRGFEHKNLIRNLILQLVIIPSIILLFFSLIIFRIFFTQFTYQQVNGLLILWTIIYFLTSLYIIFYHTRNFKYKIDNSTLNMKVISKRQAFLIKLMSIGLFIYFIINYKKFINFGKFKNITNETQLGNLKYGSNIWFEFIFACMVLLFVLFLNRIHNQSITEKNFTKKLFYRKIQSKYFLIIFILLIIFMNSNLITSINSSYDINSHIYGDNNVIGDYFVSIPQNPQNQININDSIFNNLNQIDGLKGFLVIHEVQVHLINNETNVLKTIFVVNRTLYENYVKENNFTFNPNYLENGLWMNENWYYHFIEYRENLTMQIASNSANIKTENLNLGVDNRILLYTVGIRFAPIMMSISYFKILFPTYNLSNSAFYILLKSNNKINNTYDFQNQVGKILGIQVYVSDLISTNIVLEKFSIIEIIYLNLLFGALVGIFIGVSFYSDNNLILEMKILKISYGKNEIIKQTLFFINLFFNLVYGIVYIITIFFTLYHNFGSGSNIFVKNNYYLPPYLNIGDQIFNGIFALVGLNIMLFLFQKRFYKIINEENQIKNSKGKILLVKV